MRENTLKVVELEAEEERVLEVAVAVEDYRSGALKLLCNLWE